MYKIYIGILFLFSAVYISIGGGNQGIDSLLKILPNTSGKAKADALNKLSRSYVSLNPRQALVYAKQALKESQLLNDSMLIARSYKNIGLSYDYMGNIIDALRNYQISLTMSRQIGFYKNSMVVLNNIGIIYKIQGEFSKSLECYFEEITNAEKLNDTQMIAIASNNIGSVYQQMRDYDNAEAYFNKTLNISYETNDINGLAISYSNLGELFILKKDYSNALTCLKKAYKFALQTSDEERIAKTLSSLGEIYFATDNIKEAIYSYNKALNYFNKIDDTLDIAYTALSLGKAEMKRKNYHESESYFDKCIELSLKKGFILNLQEVYLQMADLKSEMQDFKDAYHYQKLYSEITDTIFQIEKLNKIAELQNKFSVKEKEKEINQLNYQQKLKDMTLSREKFILILTLIILVLFITLAYILFNLLHKRTETNKMLAKANLEYIKTLTELEKLKFDLNVNENLTKQEIEQIEPEKEQNVTKKNASTDVVETLKESQTSSVLNEEQFKKLLKNITKQMEEKRIYLDPKLTIDTLAELLSTNRTYISKVVNEAFGKNFNGYVNDFRIKEALKILSDTEYSNFNIESIATLAGFNNKTTFNTTFKKSTGLTPSIYRENIQDKE